MAVFQTYNQAIWPLQAVAYLLGALAVFLVLRPTPHSGRLISAVLGVLWLINGLGYHLGFFSAINAAAYAFAGLFAAGGLLFLLAGTMGNKIVFQPRGGAGRCFSRCLGWFWVAYAMVIYPVLGHLLGHAYPRSPVFGVAPCPTVVFTLGLLLLAARLPRYLLAAPLIWSLVGLSAAWNLGVYEDYGLVLAGLSALALIVFRDKRPANPLRAAQGLRQPASDHKTGLY